MVTTIVALRPVTSRLIAGEGISILCHCGLCRRDQTDNGDMGQPGNALGDKASHVVESMIPSC